MFNQNASYNLITLRLHTVRVSYTFFMYFIIYFYLATVKSGQLVTSMGPQVSSPNEIYSLVLTLLTSAGFLKARAKGAALIAPPLPNEPRPPN